MKPDKETARVNILEVLTSDVSGGGTYEERSAALDWAEEFGGLVASIDRMEAAAAKRRAQRRARGEIVKEYPDATFLRLEWPKRDDLPRDWLDADAHTVASPSWVDVIAHVKPDFLVRVRMVPGETGPEPQVFEVRGLDNQLTAKKLRISGFGGVIDTLSAALKADRRMRRILGNDWRRQPRRPGRGGQDDLYYAEKAQEYVAACKISPAPIVHLIKKAKDEGRPLETAPQWRGWLNKARQPDRALLTAAPPGQAGGELTDKCKRLLDPPTKSARKGKR